MADSPDSTQTADAAGDELSPGEHLAMIGAHNAAIAAHSSDLAAHLAGAHAGDRDGETAGGEQDDAGSERGMGRFTAKSAQRGAVTGAGAIRSFQAMRGGR